MTTDRDAFDTRLIHAGEAPDPTTGAHGVPMYQNATYAFRSFDQVEAFEAGTAPHFTYGRYGNPTTRCFELKMADLEGAESAAAAANGMAAIAATLLELTSCGGHVVAGCDLYQVSAQVLDRDVPAGGGAVTRVDLRDLAAVEAAVEERTRAIYCETFSNPRMHVADLPALAGIAKRRGLLLAVDNTFLSPALLRPIELGADVVIHSATKYLSGSGQVMGGVVAGRRAFVDAVGARLSRQGGTMTPFAAWLLLAGVKTLSLRMERHSATTQLLAEALAESAAVEAVNYPGLAGSAGHEAALRMSPRGAGGLLSFRLRGGRAAARAFVDSLRICTIAVSLGEPTTLIWPLRDGLLRLAVGLEDSADLLREVERGLAAADAATVTIG